MLKKMVYFFGMFYNIFNKKVMGEMKIVCNKMDSGIIRVEIYDNDMLELGCLYFEKGKNGFNRKPIGDGWVCVDAMVGGKLYEYSGMDSREIMEMCQEEIKKNGIW